MRDRRVWIFLAVLLAHLALVRIAWLASMRALPRGRDIEPLTLIYLPPPAQPAPASPATPPAAATRPRIARRPAAPSNEPEPGNAITPEAPAALPPIDWTDEAQRVAKNFADNLGKPGHVDLSALRPEQLGWIKRNHFEPAPPGIAWTRPRWEFDKNSGLPMFWINERCVLVMLFVFCGVGHIQHDGTLFNHMSQR